ncbi:hypothetical protein EVA_06229 [gut metagenome]|uniref:Uncharacterized protein n=1 Tax=gut metagenome TaxID=749906 RepID=J9GEA2_9ZZZZ
MEVHHTVQFDVTDTALEHAMLGSQLFATDVIAYAFQVYKPVNQNEGKENGKEGGDRCKRGVLHSSIDQSHGTKQQQGQFVNEELCRLRS